MNIETCLSSFDAVLVLQNKLCLWCDSQFDLSTTPMLFLTDSNFPSASSKAATQNTAGRGVF
jgi:hypothetical protein